MYQKTESSEFASGFFWQICLLAFLAIAFVLYFQKILWPDDTPALFPWVVAAGHTIENGLLAFGGRPATAPGGREEASVLFGLLLAAVLSPTIFLLEWRRRRVSGPARHERRPLRVSGVIYALSGVIVLSMAVTILPITIASESARSGLRHSQAVLSNRDAVIYEMNLIDIDLSQFYILPKELGGGNHSYEGYRLPQQLATTDDARYIVTAENGLADLRATSVRFPSCWVSAKVDSAGTMGEWTFGEEFQ
jgi:hypothetical protein